MSDCFFINLIEALYLVWKSYQLKQQAAPDSAYKQMVDSASPVMTITLIFSVLALVIAWLIT
ncbi:hypothetical protein BU064_00700 [Staphylococcus succinus]|nr:hypothetical protein BU064_00700 [Staphylococcus succinus]